MIPIANTKEVSTNGMISVSQGQCKTMASTNAAVERKNNNQYRPFDLCFISIDKIFAKIGEKGFSNYF